MNDQVYNVAIDDGYAQMKLYGDAVGGGAPVRSVFRTSARAGRDGLAAIGGGGSINGYTVEEGEEFCISDRIPGEGTQFDGFHFSSMNRALVKHSLVLGGYEGQKVGLVVGLPVADYFSAGGINQERVERKKANLRKGVKRTMGKGGELPEIVRVDVGCQAVAAFVDFAYGDDLDVREDIKDRSVAIVDIGGRTTDIATIVGGENIDFSKSGTANIGALDVYKAVQADLGVHHGVRESLPIAALAEAVKTGQIEIYGDMVSIDDIIERAKRQVQGNIQREIERRIGNGASLYRVLFVGGTSAMFPDFADSYSRNARMVEDPEIANARGLWKFAKVLATQAQAA